MLIVRNNIIPFSGYAAINLFGVLFVRNGVRIDDRLLNHERIHTRQQLELLFLPFFILYLAEWIIGLFRFGFDSNRAYQAITFEREAYANQDNPGYLPRRPLFAQWRRTALSR